MSESSLTQPHFQEADEARKYLEAQVWPKGEQVCPHCAVISQHYVLTGKGNRPGLYKCKDCRKPFTVTVGSIFERSKIPLNKWLMAVYLLCSSKKGVSSHQLHRTLGVTYKTAWFMTHRIREAMTGGTMPLGSDGGAVEVDETFWGNKKHRGAPKKGRGYHHKMKVVSLVARSGEKRSFQVPSVNAKTLRPILKAQIAAQAHLMTDAAFYYTTVGREFAQHGVVDHNIGEYSRGIVSTNTVESSFSLLKRGLYGTFHHVGEQHLQRYCVEFDFRWNYRAKLGFDDAQRADMVLRSIQGKRLTYRRTNREGASPLI